jgi:hypothetical protein
VQRYPIISAGFFVRIPELLVASIEPDSAVAKALNTFGLAFFGRYCTFTRRQGAP